MLNYFKIIIGYDDCPYHKPDPRGLLLIAEKLNIEPEKMLYIGDHPVDAKAAIATKMEFIATLTGQHLKKDFEDFNTHSTVDTIADLPELILT